MCKIMRGKCEPIRELTVDNVARALGSRSVQGGVKYR